jgi:hypothetical protein
LFPILFHLIFTISSQGKYDYPYFTDKEKHIHKVAQLIAVELEFEPLSSASAHSYPPHCIASPKIRKAVEIITTFL